MLTNRGALPVHVRWFRAQKLTEAFWGKVNKNWIGRSMGVGCPHEFHESNKVHFKEDGLGANKLAISSGS